MRDGFVFHAKDVFGKHKKAEGWDWERCYQITEAWIQIIADLRIPWVAGWSAKTRMQGGQFTFDQNTVSHMVAFALCFQACDEMVALLAPNDIASVIAEDCPNMRGILKGSTRAQVAGEFRKLSGMFERPITHIKNAVQFCDKADAVLLQLADVCAYSVKRYITGSPGGDRLFHALNGKPQFMVRRDNVGGDTGGVIAMGWEQRGGR
jgi:hypothetical protein